MISVPPLGKRPLKGLIATPPKWETNGLGVSLHRGWRRSRTPARHSRDRRCVSAPPMPCSRVTTEPLCPCAPGGIVASGHSSVGIGTSTDVGRSANIREPCTYQGTEIKPNNDATLKDQLRHLASTACAGDVASLLSLGQDLHAAGESARRRCTRSSRSSVHSESVEAWSAVATLRFELGLLQRCAAGLRKRPASRRTIRWRCSIRRWSSLR